MPQPDTTTQWRDWRWHMRHAVTDPLVLVQRLGLEPAVLNAWKPVAARYPLRITPYYLSLRASDNVADPILRQCLPDPAEIAADAGAAEDPLQEMRDSPCPGLIHRYTNRAVVLLTDMCAVNCRHCMRKRCWGVGGGVLSAAHIESLLAYVRRHGELRELLISGGDPLLAPEATLDRLLGGLTAMDHVEVVRIGSRLPVVLPFRLTRDFCALFDRGFPFWFATHFNHPAELTDAAAEAVEHLLRAGVPVVNQTVLLKGVNDDADTLAALFSGLLRLRVKPYYLCLGDPVRGTLHWRTGLDRGVALMAALRERVSGLALPSFAFDLPDGGGKIRLEPDCFAGTAADGTALYRDRRGRACPYPEPEMSPGPRPADS